MTGYQSKKAAAQAKLEQKPVAVWELFEDGWDSIADPEWMESLPIGTKLYTTPPKREWVVFPTMLRKMWSGGEVQAWLDENVNKEKNT